MFSLYFSRVDDNTSFDIQYSAHYFASNTTDSFLYIATMAVLLSSLIYFEWKTSAIRKTEIDLLDKYERVRLYLVQEQSPSSPI